ncbi:MAG: MATE family efflux transporter [Clostridia bacterium]|nr:MATE family efflux transporter [Clostridia bacterium]
MLKKIDATQGSMVKAIFSFSIPLILATIAQNLFTIADKAVLGNMAGSVEVAAIGATGTVTELIINGAVGLSSGTTIVLARFWGQRDEEKIRTTVDTALITGVGLGVIVAIAGFLSTPFFLTATDCPAECYEGALLYMRIYISAAPITLFYNYGSAILRTTGDTQRPLIYILAGGVVNVVLNVILCLILPQKVAAVAIATVASKLVSGVLVARRLCRMEEDYVRVSFRKMRFDTSSFFRIFRFGIPTSISNIMYPLAGLQIVPAINSYGVAAVAGNSAAASVNSIAMAFSSGFSAATSTFVGQNIGARKVDRVKKAFWYSLGWNVLVSGSVGVILFLSGRFLIGTIIGHGEVEAIDYGMSRMAHISLFMFVQAISASIGGALQAFGYAALRSISNVVFSLGFRILWMQLVYPRYQSFDTVMLCFTVSWILNMLFYAAVFAVVYYRYVKKGICKKI